MDCTDSPPIYASDADGSVAICHRCLSPQLREMTSSKSCLIAVCLIITAMAGVGVADASIRDDFSVKGDTGNVVFSGDGNAVTLKLVSRSSGCRLSSNDQFVFGSVWARIQLVPGNSAGTVTTLYMSSVGSNHDEIDFEFLGNETGQPYTLQTNVYVNDVGGREVQFQPWFDPTAGYHNYSISWTPCAIVWYVDGTPIHVYRKHDGVAFPTGRPMFAYASIWAAENWATQGGRVKTDWSKAPFVANYRDVVLDVCKCTNGVCATNCRAEECSLLSDAELGRMRAVQGNYKIYDYCHDLRRFNGHLPNECSLVLQ